MGVAFVTIVVDRARTRKDRRVEDGNILQSKV